MHLTNGHSPSQEMHSLSYLSSDRNGASSQDIPDRLPFTAEMFYESAHKWPNNIALVCAHQAPDLYDIPSVPNPDLCGDEQRRPYLRWTYQGLKSGVDRLKAGLRSLGVGRGTAVVTLMPNCAEYVLMWWAARSMGLVMAPLNPRNLSNRDEVAHMIDTIVKGTGGQPPIFMVFDQELLESEPLVNTRSFVKIFVSPRDRHPKSEGVLFSDLMTPPEKNGSTIGHHQEQPTDDEIMFSSGSTFRPKAIKLQHPTLTLGMYNFSSTPGCDRRPADLWLAMTPNNHGMGRSAITSSMCSGGGTVYPGFFFSVQEAAEVLLTERCTHAALVPTLIRTLADAVGPRLGKTAGDGRRLLRTVFLSGAPPTRADLQKCSDVLGIETITSIYGMTEGAEANTPAHSDWAKLVSVDGMLSVGTPRSRGAALKICAPDASGPDRPPLPLGTPGDIHYCGPERLPRPTIYMDKPDAEDFCYFDGQGRRWFVTGDRGVVGVDRQLYIIGRSKDMIIRGGENMAPAAIEACLADNPALAHLVVQIVGAPDAVAGEVPVAVVAVAREEVKRVAREMHDTVVKRMGPMFVPSHVIPLEALGVKDWPRTVTGKIKKVHVAELVNKYLQDSEQAEANAGASPDRERLASEILGVWAMSVGLEEDSLSTDQPIAEFADSLTIARVIRRIKRAIPGCGSLSPQDMLRVKTIKDQIELIVGLATVQRVTRNGEPYRAGPPQRVGPPGAEDMVHLTEQPTLLHHTKQLVTETINGHGFEWEDVDDVFPAQCCVSELGRTGVVDSAKFHIADLMTAEKDAKKVQKAVQTMLCHNRVLASFLVWDKEGRYDLDPELALHVTLKHSQKLFDGVIQVSGSVKTVQELQSLALNCPEPTRALLPGILFRALIYTVEETKTVGLLYIISHAVLDASSIWMFQEDLECILSGKPMQPHVDYKLWADTYYSFRGSPQARAAVNWHANYLSGIEDHLPKALWPPVPQRGPLDPTGADYPSGVHYSFRAPNITALRQKYPELTAPVILKSALALLQAWHTGHTHSLFASCEDGRTRWPFAPPSTRHLLGDAQDVSGPTIQFVTNLVRIDPGQTVVDFLRCVRADQDQLTRHEHAPWPDIERALGARRGTIRRVFTTIKFNWVPGFGAQAQTDRANAREPFRNLRILAAVARWRIGLLCRLGLGGMNNDTVVMHLMGDALGGGDKARVAKSLQRLTIWLTDPERWEAPVGGFQEVVAGDGEVVDEESMERMTRNLGLSCQMPRESGKYT